MIAPINKTHSLDFNERFPALFQLLTARARSMGINKYRGHSGSATAEDPEEFAQECLLEYRRIAIRKGLPSVQVHLIHDLATKRIQDAWRRQRKIPDTKSIEAPDISVTECTSASVSVSETHIFSKLLKPKAIEILHLKYLARYSESEIAEAMGMKVDGVRSSIKRSKRKIKSAGRASLITSAANTPD